MHSDPVLLKIWAQNFELKCHIICIYNVVQLDQHAYSKWPRLAYDPNDQKGKGDRRADILLEEMLRNPPPTQDQRWNITELPSFGKLFSENPYNHSDHWVSFSAFHLNLSSHEWGPWPLTTHRGTGPCCLLDIPMLWFCSQDCRRPTRCLCSISQWCSLLWCPGASLHNWMWQPRPPLSNVLCWHLSFG